MIDMEQNNYKSLEDFKQIWQELYKVDFSQEMSHDEEVKALILQKYARSCFDTLRSFPATHTEQNTNAEIEDMQIVLKVLEAVEREWETDFSEMIEYGTKNPRAEAEHSIVMAELDREMAMLNEQLEMLHQNQDVRTAESTVEQGKTETAAELLSDMEHIGHSQPAWSGHEYAVEYLPARDAMLRLSEFAEEYGNKEQADEIREWLASGEMARKETDEKGTQTLYQKSDERFDELLKEGIKDVAAVLAREQAKDYLTQPLAMMYVDGENDSAHYGYLANFNAETLKTMADIAKCDAGDVRAAFVEIGVYTSGSPTSVDVTLVDSNAQYHNVKGDDISPILTNFKDDIIATSDYTDKAEIRTEPFVEYGMDGAQYTPAQLALMGEFENLYLKLFDSINGHMQSMSEKTMNHEELRRLYDDASYLGVSAPAWSGHEYAVEYEPAREVLSHLEQYERQLGNIEQANDIKELLNPSVGFSPNDVKHLEETEKRYWELFDKSFARLESNLFHPQQEFTPAVKMDFIDNNGTLAYAYAHFKLTIDNPEIRNDLISRLNIKTDKTDSVEFYLQVADEEESIMQAKINNSVFTIPLTEAEKSEYAFNANLFMEREYNCTIENYIDSGDRYYGEFGEYPKWKMEKNHKDYEVTTTVTGHLEIGKETVPDMSGGYDEAIEQLLENANLGAMNSAEIIGKNFDEHEMLLNIQGKFTVSVEALNESQAIRLAEQTFQRADFQDLQNVTHEEWTNVDTEKLVELIDNINGQMQPMAADDKSNFTKEGTTMENAGWGKQSKKQAQPTNEGQGKDVTENLQTKAEAQQAEQVQATPQEAAKKEPAMAQIAKSTSEAMKDNPAMRKLAFELMKTAKEMGAKAKEQGLTTTGRHKSKTGETYETVNKFYVKVEPVTSKDKSDGNEQTNLLGSITHTIGNTTLAVHTKKDSAELSSITAVKFNSQHQKEAYAKGNDEIQANPAFNKYAKSVAQMIQDEGFVKAQEQTREKPIMLQFAQYAQAEIFKNGAQVMKEDGTTVADCYANYKRDDQYGDRTELRSHTAKDIVIEVGYKQDEQYGEQPYAKATNFGLEKDDNNRFPSIYINKAEDLSKPEFEKVPAEIKQAVADFKGFDQREQQKTTEQKSAPKKNSQQVER